MSRSTAARRSGGSRSTDYDVVVLDRDLPGVHGDEVCRALVADGRPSRGADADCGRRRSKIGSRVSVSAPTTISPSRSTSSNWSPAFARFRGARARRSPRRSSTAISSSILPADRVTRAGKPIALSPKEFAVLELLLGAEGAVVSSEQMLERAWDDAVDPFTNTVRMTMSRLRAKLGDPPVIETVTPVGYRIGDAP